MAVETKYDYPMSEDLLSALREEYRNEAAKKGNSWRNKLSIDELFSKSTEEHNEIIEEYRMIRSNNREALSDEIIDEILVLMMLWERLNEDNRPSINYVDAGFSVHEKCPKCKAGWLEGYRADGMCGHEKCTNPTCDYDESYP